MFIYVQWHRQQRPKLILALTWWSLALLNGAGSNGSTLTPMVKEKWSDSGCDLSEQQSIDSSIVAAVLFEMFLMLFLSLDVWFEVVCSWIGDVFQMSYMFAAVFGMRCLLWLSTNLKVDGLFAVGCCVVSVVGYHWKVGHQRDLHDIWAKSSHFSGRPHHKCWVLVFTLSQTWQLKILAWVRWFSPRKNPIH